MCTRIILLALLCRLAAAKRINATCSWGDPNSGRIDPFACYVRIPFKLTPNDTLLFNSEIDATDISEVNFWLSPASRYQWDITFIPSGIFEKFPNLRSFSLPGHVESVTHSDFVHATNLVRLTLRNQLKVIVGSVFDQMTKLEVLDLSWNKITSIHEQGFKGLGRLSTLRLNRNQIHKLKVHTFQHVPLLEELLLNNNHIETVDDGTLRLSHLKHLDLSYNKLKDLSNSIFKDCPNLEYLDLRSNHLTEIRRSIYGLNKLQFLNLDNNHISDVNFRALVHLRSLEHLSLEDNGQSFNDNVFVSETVAFSTSQIKELFLSGNGLRNREILVRLWAMGLTHLEKLHLDNNAFEYIDFHPIDAFPKLKEINLGKNYWKCDWLEQTLDRLEADGIKANIFSSRFPSSTAYKHINFIPCI